jgi:hypothetical protein
MSNIGADLYEALDKATALLDEKHEECQKVSQRLSQLNADILYIQGQKDGFEQILAVLNAEDSDENDDGDEYEEDEEYDEEDEEYAD